MLIDNIKKDIGLSYLNKTTEFKYKKAWMSTLNNWILATGFWRDIGVWIDTEVWTDG